MRTGRVRKLANPDSESLFLRGRLLDPVEVEILRPTLPRPNVY
jgi:hypothetical protein